MDSAFDYEYTIFSNSYSLPLSDSSNKTKEQILLIATVSFAKYGYASVSMRDLAKVMGIQQSSLYNHFASKEALWKEVLEHASSMYMLYFNHLNEVIEKAGSFEEVLEAIFYEPKRLVNVFSSYAFCMIQAEQFRDERAGAIFEETFLGYSIDFIQGWFEQCVAKGMVQPFDTKTVACVVMHSVLIGLDVQVHRHLNHPYSPPYDARKMFSDLQRFILQAVAVRQKSDEPGV